MNRVLSNHSRRVTGLFLSNRRPFIPLVGGLPSPKRFSFFPRISNQSLSVDGAIITNSPAIFNFIVCKKSGKRIFRSAHTSPWWRRLLQFRPPLILHVLAQRLVLMPLRYFLPRIFGRWISIHGAIHSGRPCAFLPLDLRRLVSEGQLVFGFDVRHPCERF